jgi:hypothetical protein
VPDPYHRDLVLRQSGHGYLPGLTEVAVVLAVGGVAGLLGAAARGGPHRERRFAVLAGAMVATQVAAFVALEMVERLVAHATLADLSHQHLLAIGVLTQAVVASLGAAVLAWLTRATRHVAAVLRDSMARPRPRPRASFALVASAARSTASHVLVADPIRGPPPR